MEHVSHIAAWFPARVKIAGVRLSPPTLGHWRLLEAAGSPFAVGGEANVADVRAALAVLTLPWRKASRLLPRQRRFALRCAWKGGRATIADARALEEWLGCVWRTPERYVKDGEASGDGFPPCCGLAVRYAMRANRLSLIRLFPFGARNVWDLPVPFVLWGCVAAAELDGAEFEAEEETTTSTSTDVSGASPGKGSPRTPL